MLDNARYQRCRLVQDTAAVPGIELLFLPPYSPHFNLIERFWKFVKKECSYSKRYAEFRDFKKAIITCIQTANVTHKDALSSLLTWNFQSFKNVNVIPF